MIRVTRRGPAGPGPVVLRFGACLVLLVSACSTTLPTPSPEPSPAEASPSPGCGTGDAGFHDAAAQLDRELDFEGQPLQLVTASMSMRDGSMNADDAIPGFVGLGPALPPVRLPRGVAGLLTGRGGLELTRAQVTVYEWADFTFAEGELPTLHSAGSPGFATPDAQGAILVTAPARAGDYVLGFTLQWQTACLRGDGVAYGRMLVD